VREPDGLDEQLQGLGQALRQLPAPVPPGGLVSRVRRLARAELAARAEARLERVLLVLLLAFSWVISGVSFLGVRLLSGEGLAWPAAYLGSVWVAVAGALLLFGVHVRKERGLA
jgi:hypothetical protein